jgi:WD40 repeat protein
MKLLRTAAWIILALLASTHDAVGQPRLLATLKAGESLAFSPDGKILAVGGDKAVTLLDVATQKEVRRFRTGMVCSVAFSPDGRSLAAGGVTRSGEGELRVWDLSTGTSRNFKGHASQITCVVFGPDGKTLVSGGLGWRIMVWNVATGKNTAVFQGNSPILSLASSPKGKLAYGSTASNFCLFDLETGERYGLNERTTVNVHVKGRLYVAFSPDGAILATGSADQTILLWDVASGKVLRTLKGHVGSVTCLAFDPGGKVLVTGSADKTIRTWDVAIGRTTAVLVGHADAISSLAISPNGRMFASASQDGTILLWEADR